VQVRRLGPNADGEQLQRGRVTNCYLAILLDQPLAEIAPERPAAEDGRRRRPSAGRP
jgi:hypothetical protein